MAHRHNLWDGTGVYCDCCDGSAEKLAEIRPREALVVKDGRHGRKHVAVVSAKEAIERLAGTVGKEAVLTFVKTLLE